MSSVDITNPGQAAVSIGFRIPVILNFRVAPWVAPEGSPFEIVILLFEREHWRSELRPSVLEQL